MVGFFRLRRPFARHRSEICYIGSMLVVAVLVAAFTVAAPPAAPTPTLAAAPPPTPTPTLAATPPAAAPAAIPPRSGVAPAAPNGHAYVEATRAAAQREAVAATDPLLATGAFARAAALFAHEADEAAFDRFLDDVVARAAHPLARAHARAARASRAAHRGAFATADVDLDALGHPRALSCVGPFDNTGGAGFGTPTPADDVAATFDAAVDGLDRPVRWRVVPRDADGGFDVGARFVARRDVRALCAVVLDAPRGGPVAVRTGASGAVAVRVGGVPLLAVNRDRPWGFDQDAAVVAVPKGRVLVVLEVGFRGRGGVVDVRFTTPDGAPLASRTSVAVADVKAAAGVKAAALDARGPALAHAGIDEVVADPQAALPRLRAAIALAQRTHPHPATDRPPAVEALLERLLSSSSLSAGERASALSRLARERARRDATAARRLYEEALRVDAASAGAWAGIALLRAEQGDEPGARAAWDEAVRLAPTSALHRADRLRFERGGGLFGSVVDDAIVNAARASADDELRALAADVLVDRGLRVDAEALLTKTADAARRALVRSDLLEARLGDDDRATADKALVELVDLLRLRLRLLPANHGAATQFLPLLLQQDPSGQKARAFVDERRALFPDRPEPLQLAARLALVRGERPAARELLASALQLTPEDGDLQRAARALAGDDQDDDALAARWLPDFDDDAVARARVDVPEDGPALGGWVASRTVATRFFDNGLLRSFEDIVVVVSDARKAQGFRAFSFAYSSGRDRVDVVAAERVRRDGRREPAERVVDRGQSGKENGAYSDARSKVAVFAALDDGDVLHVRVRREAVGQQNLFGDFFGDLEVIQGRFPVGRFHYVVEAPLSRPLSWGGRGAPAPKVTAGDDARVYEFVDQNIPGLDGEPAMPPWLEVARYLSVSTYATWGALGRWYEDLIRDQLRLDDELRAVARRMKAAAKDEPDLVRRLYEYVVTETRYVGIELGIHGWKPYPVTEVHRRRYGDCKDKASLLVALLREAGVGAQLALVRTIQLGHAAEAPPSMWAFNHAIAYVPSLDLFLDGTAERSGWRELPTSDQGALALLIDGERSRLVTIPVSPADDNRNTSNYVLRLRQDGALAVRGSERFRGAANARERRELEDPATRRQTLERQLARAMPGTQVERVETTPLGLDAAELGYDFDAVLPARASKNPDGSWSMPVSLYPHDLAGNYADQSMRRFALFLDHPWRTRNVMRYVLPPGWTVRDLPPGGRVDGRFVRFVQTVEQSADGFVVDEDTSLLARRVEVADYEQFRAEALAADQLMKRTLRVVPQGVR